MGMDASAKAAIGFLIDDEDFIKTTKSETKTCKRGHQQPENNPKFCDQDGTVFEHTETYAPTDVARALFGDDLDEDSYTPGDLHDLMETQDEIITVERSYDDEFRICGVKVADSGSHRIQTNATDLTWGKMEALYQKVVLLRDKIGLANRPIKFYSWLRISV